MAFAENGERPDNTRRKKAASIRGPEERNPAKGGGATKLGDWGSWVKSRRSNIGRQSAMFDMALLGKGQFKNSEPLRTRFPTKPISHIWRDMPTLS
jgi:hypothetical protein